MQRPFAVVLREHVNRYREGHTLTLFANTPEGRARIAARDNYSPRRAAWPKGHRPERPYAESPYRRIAAPAIEAEWRRAEIEENRADIPALIEGMRALKDAPVNHSGHIDHTPGGSPEAFTNPAPAPRHEWRPREAFRPTRRVRRDTGRMDMAELLARAYSAARMALKGKQWSEDHRQDAASAVVEAVLRRESQKGPLQPTVSKTDYSGLVLYRMATDARRAMEAETTKLEQVVHDAFTKEVVSDAPGEQLRRARDLVSTPRKARLAAVTMLADLELPTSWGPCFTVAYTAARSPWERKRGLVAGIDVAAELDMTQTAYRKQASRGHKLIAENVPTAGTMAERLHLIDPLAGSGGMVGAAKLVADWRGLDKSAPDPSAVTLTRSRKRTGRPRRTPAAWTEQLPERTRNRLHALATARQERSGLPVAQRTRATV